MDQTQQRDAAEEQYNRNFCPACGASPCTWDGRPDGFHADDSPVPGRHPDLDQVAEAFTYSILLAAFAEFGFTRAAFAAAFAAVALSDAFEDDQEA